MSNSRVVKSRTLQEEVIKTTRQSVEDFGLFAMVQVIVQDNGSMSMGVGKAEVRLGHQKTFTCYLLCNNHMLHVTKVPYSVPQYGRSEEGREAEKKKILSSLIRNAKH